MPAPSDTVWNVIVQEIAHRLRVYHQHRRDSTKKNGPKPGWEAAMLEDWRRMLEDQFGLTR